MSGAASSITRGSGSKVSFFGGRRGTRTPDLTDVNREPETAKVSYHGQSDQRDREARILIQP